MFKKGTVKKKIQALTKKLKIRTNILKLEKGIKLKAAIIIKLKMRVTLNDPSSPKCTNKKVLVVCQEYVVVVEYLIQSIIVVCIYSK